MGETRIFDWLRRRERGGWSCEILHTNKGIVYTVGRAFSSRSRNRFRAIRDVELVIDRYLIGNHVIHLQVIKGLIAVIV